MPSAAPSRGASSSGVSPSPSVGSGPSTGSAPIQRLRPEPVGGLPQRGGEQRVVVLALHDAATRLAASDERVLDLPTTA